MGRRGVRQGRWAGGEGGKKEGGGTRRKIIIYTNKICRYFVIQVATSLCTTVKPASRKIQGEVDT